MIRLICAICIGGMLKSVVAKECRADSSGRMRGLLARSRN
jgi:hypothetical protein